MSMISQHPATPAARDERNMTGKTVLLTGANSGIGFATAGKLAARGAEIVMVCRDLTRGERARAQIAELTVGPAPTLLLADLSSQAEIRELAEKISHRYEHLDVLINNAGAVFERRQLGIDGIELTFATNHLAPFLLTHLLLPLLLAAPAARIVIVASDTYSGKLDFGNLQGERRYSFLSAYNRSKLANVLFTKELARRLDGSPIAVCAVSPGPAKTHLGENMRGAAGVFSKLMKRMPFFAAPARAAETLIYAACSPELEGSSGGFYRDSRAWKEKPIATDPAIAKLVWTISEELCGIAAESSSVNIVAARGAERNV